jgi:hypothetical protein
MKRNVDVLAIVHSRLYKAHTYKRIYRHVHLLIYPPGKENELHRV